MGRHVLIYGIIWERKKLKTNACARMPSPAPGFHSSDAFERAGVRSAVACQCSLDRRGAGARCIQPKISRLKFENFLVFNGWRRVRTVSFYSTRKMSFAPGCWITVARIRATWRLRRWHHWHCVNCFMRSNLTSARVILRRLFPDIFRMSFEWRKEKSKFSREINHL